MRRAPWILIAVMLLGLWAWSQRHAAFDVADTSLQVPAESDRSAVDRRAPAPLAGVRSSDPATVRESDGRPATEQGSDAATRRPYHAAPAWLPREAIDTLRRIAGGGPYPYRQDGITFENREGHLPSRLRGDYREYTVATPGARDRGARRIITAGDPPTAFFYTGDHYRSFRRIPDAMRSP